MAVQELDLSIRPLVRSFHSARRRLWLQRGLRALAQSLCAAALFALIAAILTLFQAPQPVLSWLWAAAALTPVSGVIAAFFTRPSEAEAIRMADLHLGLHQQLGTAHELLTRGSEGSLVPWQLARASEVASDVELSRAFAVLPRREVALAGLLVAATAGTLVLVSIGVVLTNPFRDVKIPGVTKPASVASEPPLFGKPSQANSAVRRSPALDSTRQLLNQVQRQAQRGNLSQAAAASALQQASAELNKAAQESLARQEALDNLASQLRGSAAGNDVSQSLRQGDYQQAAQQIRDLGSQSDQFSSAAKQQLSQALSNAAAQSQATQQLSRPENRASQALQRQGDSQQSSYSMDRLAQAVEDTGNQVISQSELAQTWQQLDDLNRQLANSNQNNNGQSSVAPPSAQAPNSAAEKPGAPQQSASPGGAQQPSDQSADGLGQGGGQPPTGGGSGAGNTPGGPPLGNPNPPLGADGKPLDLQGQISDKFSNQPDGSGQPPSVMRQGDASTPGGQAQTADGSASVPAENVFVPSDRQSIVRDYFSSGNEGAGSQ